MIKAGYETLSLTIYINSGTGSVADITSAEGFLKIIWPKCEQYNFKEIGIDSLLIFWNKSKYKSKYKLLRSDPHLTLPF